MKCQECDKEMEDVKQKKLKKSQGKGYSYADGWTCSCGFFLFDDKDDED